MSIQQLGRYEIIAELGRGAMGVVYKAMDPLIERIVAVKSVGIGMSKEESDTFERRFYREAKSAGRLNHPNIVTIHDVGKSGDHAYIAMEFLEGRSLREILDSGVVLPPDKVADITAQIADGLAFAHRNDVVHRDIKPANIMVLQNGTVKITDFGIALLPTGSRTLAGAIFGSPKYISPEQVVGTEVDGRSDIFSLGALIYEMLTGVAPFTGNDLNAILYKVINEMPPAPSSRNRSILPAFDNIVAKAMAKHPDERYQKIEEMAVDLRNYNGLAPSVVTVRGGRTLERRAAPRQPQGETTVQIDFSPAAVRHGDNRKIAATGKTKRGASSPLHKLLVYGVPTIVIALVIAAGWPLLHKRAPKPEKAIEKTVETPPALTQPIAPITDIVESQKPSEKEPASVSPSPNTIGENQLPPETGTQPSAVQTATIAEPVKPSEAVPTSLPPPSSFEEKPSTAASHVPGSPPKPIGRKNNSAEYVKNVETTSGSLTEKKKTAVKLAGATPMATVLFAVTPWGEIYIDGKQQGISPPLRELNLPLGKHIIEIRNTTFPPHQETVDLSPNANAKVKHKFQ